MKPTAFETDRKPRVGRGLFRCAGSCCAVIAAVLGLMALAAGDSAVLSTDAIDASAGVSTPEGAAAASSGTAALRVPRGFRVAPGAVAENYSDTGWAAEIIHEKTGLVMVFVPAGGFEMGSPANETPRDTDEGPVHRVEITRPFYLGRHEITQEQWLKVMSENPSYFRGDRRPVEQASWNQFREFFNKAGAGLRFPTEAEWEYACRAGTRGLYSFSGSESGLRDYAWFRGADGDFTHDAAAKKPNAWGLFDMHGNVWEWCADWYDRYYYAKSPGEDPKGPDTGLFKVARGGGYGDPPGNCRCAVRVHDRPDAPLGDYGARAARNAE